MGERAEVHENSREEPETTDIDTINIDPALLVELLDAANRTALAHRDDKHEMYVLGQLEATASIIYVIAAMNGNDALETLCQKAAQGALSRFAEITAKKGNL